MTELLKATLKRGFTYKEVGFPPYDNNFIFEAGTEIYLAIDETGLDGWQARVDGYLFDFGVDTYDFKLVQPDNCLRLLIAYGGGFIEWTTDGSVYFYSMLYSQEPQEVLMWSSDEFVEDPSLLFTVMVLQTDLMQHGWDMYEHDLFHCVHCGDEATMIFSHRAMCGDCRHTLYPNIEGES